MISHVNKLGTVSVGDSNPVRIMGILNTSPESFIKKSISIGRQKIVDAVHTMEDLDFALESFEKVGKKLGVIHNK